VAEKLQRVSESLAGLARVSFQMSVADLPKPQMMRSIELLGSHVRPLMRQV
jgi:hypothetical protein